MGEMKRPKAKHRTSSREHQNSAGQNAGKTRPRATAKAARDARAERRREH